MNTNPVQYLAHQLASPWGLGAHVVAPLLNWRNGPLIRAAAELTAARPGESVADIGFGGGLGLDLLLAGVGSSGVVHGLDTSAAMVSRAHRRWRAEVHAGRLNVHRMAIGDVDCASWTFDAMMTINTVYYIEDLPAAFGATAQVIKPTGRMIVGVGDPRYMKKLPVTKYGLRVRDIDFIAEMLCDSGYQIENHVRVGKPVSDYSFHLLKATLA